MGGFDDLSGVDHYFHDPTHLQNLGLSAHQRSCPYLNSCMSPIPHFYSSNCWTFYVPSRQEQDWMKDLGNQGPRFAQARGHQQHLPPGNTTYLAKIAVVLQGTQNKMLTFTKLMEKLAPQMPGDRKSTENKVRVCLTTNKCFVKVPVVPNLPSSKRNYWKLDTEHITGKMARRHFKGLLQLFPELVAKIKMENDAKRPEARAHVRPRAGQKFTGAFAIDTILESAGPSEEAPGSEEARQPPSAQAPPQHFPIFPVDGGIHREFTFNMCSNPLFLVPTEMLFRCHTQPWPLCPPPAFPLYP